MRRMPWHAWHSSRYHHGMERSRHCAGQSELALGLGLGLERFWTAAVLDPSLGAGLASYPRSPVPATDGSDCGVLDKQEQQQRHKVTANQGDLARILGRSLKTRCGKRREHEPRQFRGRGARGAYSGTPVVATNNGNWHAESQGDHDEHAHPVPPEAAHSGPMVARGVHDREAM
eukprot:scaffold25556_cov70-Phaeocystis_antarctica.AAC.1